MNVADYHDMIKRIYQQYEQRHTSMKIENTTVDSTKPQELFVKNAPANEVQIGGDHYKHMAIQPWDFIESNKIPFLEGCAIKYLARWHDKGGVADLHKAIHFIQKRIELETAAAAGK